MFYFVKTPWLLRNIYASYTWRIPSDQKTLYLTFDDGPHPVATPFVLDKLKQYNAKGTFFCLGKNVVTHPRIFERILLEGHSVGNHTHNHLHGWKTANDVYIKDIAVAAGHIKTHLFRPPYGKIRFSQASRLKEAMNNNKPRIIMWDVLSGDFDTKVSPEKTASNVISNSAPGSIIVFHDSEKAYNSLAYALPKVLDHFSARGYDFRGIN